jgi:8-oxo-dGTP diphosphatase
MQGYNCIVVYNQDGDKILFCKRRKNPYMGLYNLVGGKIEAGENGYEAAYRELEEETGITKMNIDLFHMMDFTYYNQDCYVEVYAGYLKTDIRLREEVHPLIWLELNENFFDSSKFAGEGNIGHMLEQVKCYGMGIPKERL